MVNNLFKQIKFEVKSLIILQFFIISLNCNTSHINFKSENDNNYLEHKIANTGLNRLYFCSKCFQKHRSLQHSMRCDTRCKAILFHGLNGNHHSMSNWKLFLKKHNFKSIICPNRKSKNSKLPIKSQVDIYYKHIENLINNSNKNDSLYIGGHSFGGIISLLALQKISKCEKTINKIKRNNTKITLFSVGTPFKGVKYLNMLSDSILLKIITKLDKDDKCIKELANCTYMSNTTSYALKDIQKNIGNNFSFITVATKCNLLYPIVLVINKYKSIFGQTIKNINVKNYAKDPNDLMIDTGSALAEGLVPTAINHKKVILDDVSHTNVGDIQKFIDLFFNKNQKKTYPLNLLIKELRKLKKCNQLSSTILLKKILY